MFFRDFGSRTQMMPGTRLAHTNYSGSLEEVEHVENEKNSEI